MIMNREKRRSVPRAVLLDFYGTVVEEDDLPVGKICEEIRQASPLTTTAAEIGSCWGRLFAQLCSESFGATFRSQNELERLSLQLVLERFKADLGVDALSQRLYEYWARPTMFPESRAVLAKCGAPVCLVSNIDNAELQSALKHNHLHFDCIVTSEDCRAYKPRAEMFQRALSLIGLRPGEVLHVGDSFRSDVQGAKPQGIPALWVNRKRRPVPSDGGPDYVSADLTGLLDAIEGRG